MTQLGSSGVKLLSVCMARVRVRHLNLRDSAKSEAERHVKAGSAVARGDLFDMDLSLERPNFKQSLRRVSIRKYFARCVVQLQHRDPANKVRTCSNPRNAYIELSLANERMLLV
jgi:hypothetical protein